MDLHCGCAIVADCAATVQRPVGKRAAARRGYLALNEDLACRVGWAIAEFVKPRKVAVGRDIRLSYVDRAKLNPFNFIQVPQAHIPLMQRLQYEVRGAVPVRRLERMANMVRCRQRQALAGHR
jgi:hypothetical protein